MPRRDGFHELDGPYELVELRADLPVSYASLSRSLPDVAEERAIAARIAAFTGREVRLVDWQLEEGDPRDSGRRARVELIDDALARATAALRDARARLAQAEAEHDAASGHEQAETYGPVVHWTSAVAAATAAWRAIAGPDAPEPDDHSS